MNRRSFFTSLGAVAAACAAPSIFIPKFEPVRWKFIKPSMGRVLYAPNPDYIQAKYAVGWLFGFPSIGQHIDLTYPVRGNEFDSRGMLIPIPPFIRVES